MKVITYQAPARLWAKVMRGETLDGVVRITGDGLLSLRDFDREKHWAGQIEIPLSSVRAYDNSHINSIDWLIDNGN